MPLLVNFLLVFSYSEKKLISVEEFSSVKAAAEAYRAAEDKYKDRDDQFEVVLVGADSLDTVQKTHGHYFADPAETQSPFANLLS